jgi:hypothetical protein
MLPGETMTIWQTTAAILFGGPFVISGIVAAPAAFSMRYRRALHRHLIN